MPQHLYLRIPNDGGSTVHDFSDFLLTVHRRKGDRKPVCAQQGVRDPWVNGKPSANRHRLVRNPSGTTAMSNYTAILGSAQNDINAIHESSWHCGRMESMESSLPRTRSMSRRAAACRTARSIGGMRSGSAQSPQHQLTSWARYRRIDPK